MFFGTGCVATIKHRCVTHLCGWNSIRQVEVFTTAYMQRKSISLT